MAIIHKSKNQLGQRARKQLALAIFLFCFPIFLIAYYTFTGRWATLMEKEILIPWLIALLVSIFLGRHLFRQYKILSSGLNGEKAALEIAKNLPDGYHIFNSLRFHHGKTEREIDLIIIGKQGVFIIEVKNYRGIISGDLKSNHWTQTKTSKKNETYTNPISNPTKQVKSQVEYLNRFLNRRGVNVTCHGIVLFTHEECKLQVSAGETPVLQSYKQLQDYIKSQSTSLQNLEVKKVIKELDHLVN